MKAGRQRVYEIDGRRFSTLEGFYTEVSLYIIPGVSWGHNLNAFNDILRGGFGTPLEGFTIRWLHHTVSKERLGYQETIRQLEETLEYSYPTPRPDIVQYLEDARAFRGETVFDWLVEIIRRHGEGGEESGDCVTLVLA